MNDEVDEMGHPTMCKMPWSYTWEKIQGDGTIMGVKSLFMS
jgi:hypothetical protein